MPGAEIISQASPPCCFMAPPPHPGNVSRASDWTFPCKVFTLALRYEPSSPDENYAKRQSVSIWTQCAWEHGPFRCCLFPWKETLIFLIETNLYRQVAWRTMVGEREAMCTLSSESQHLVPYQGFEQCGLEFEQTAFSFINNEASWLETTLVRFSSKHHF